MAQSATDARYAPTAIHRALDHAMALLVRVQRLQRRIHDGLPIDPSELSAHLEEERQLLNDLVAILAECRDQQRELA